MEDAFDLLAGDHEEIRQMLSELEKGPTLATGATEDQLMLRSMMTCTGWRRTAPAASST